MKQKTIVLFQVNKEAEPHTELAFLFGTDEEWVELTKDACFGC